jgi:hypothetical protein
MIKALKEYIAICFTLSLVASYFACFGYYTYFNLDITSYLEISDLILIYAKFIGLSFTLILFAFSPLYFFFNPEEESWMDKTIGKSNYKWRAFVMLLIMLIIFGTVTTLWVLNSKEALHAISNTMAIGGFILIIIGIIYAIYQGISEKKDLKEINFREWLGIYFILMVVIYLIPLLGSFAAAKKIQQDKIIVKFEGGELLKQCDSVNLLYIGKTSKFFFIYNKKTKTTISYSMDKVKSFELIPHSN